MFRLFKHLPLLVALSAFASTLLIWHFLSLNETQTAKKIIKNEAETLKSNLESQTRNHVRALERMAQRWSVRGGTPQEEWVADATRHTTDFNGYQAVEWVDQTGHVRWIMPEAGNEKAINFDLTSEINRRTALEKARNEHITTVSRSIELVTGGKGFIVFVPIYTGDNFGGFIVGIFRADNFVASSFPPQTAENYSIELFDNDRDVFQSSLPDSESREFMTEETVDFYGAPWTLRITPNRQTIAAIDSRADEWSLIIGTILSILLAWTVLLAQQARRRAAQATEAKIGLEKEIGERARIQKALQETSALQKAFLNGANYMIIATDAQGTIISFNKAAERNLGYTADELVGKATPAVFHDSAEVVERARELTEELGQTIEPGFEAFVIKARTKQVDEREWTYIRKDGSCFPVTLSITALRNEEGKITGFLGIADDISDKRRAEEDIRSAEKRFETFMNNSPAVTYLKDSDGKYVFINKTMEQMFDVNVAKLSGKTDFDWLPEDVAYTVREKDETVLRTGETLEFTQIIRTSDGVARTWKTYKFPFYSGGGKSYIGAIGFDITHQQESEKALRKSEQYNRDLIEKSPGLICTHTLDGTLLSVNPAAARSLGYEPEELIGRSLLDFLPADRQNLFGEFLRQLKTHKGLSATMRVVSKSGEERTWSYTNTLYEEEDGNSYVLGHAVDITEKQLAEIAVRESEERLRSFIENTPAAVAMLDCQMRYVMASKRWMADYSLNEEKLIGQSHYDVFPDPSEDRREVHRRALKGEVIKCDEEAFFRADGSMEWLRWEVRPWRNNRGEIGGVIFLTEFITERKQAAEALRRNSEHLSEIIKTQNEIAVSQLDLNKVMNLIVERIQVLTESNGAAIELIEGDEMVYKAAAGQEVAKHVGLRLKVASSLSGLCVRTGEILKCDDSEIDSRVDREACRLIGVRSMLLVPLIHQGKPVGALKVMSDKVAAFGERDLKTLQLMAGLVAAAMSHNTEFEARKQVETELERARDVALESARLKSEFLANMSHEIRTPMNGVIGMTDMLLCGDLTQDQREHAEIIKSSADGLLAIINDILDFSKIEAGKLSFEIIDFDLLHTVESSLELFAEQAQNKKIEIASLIESDVSIALRGDPGRLRQILTNLVGNAVKFTEKGEVVVHVTKEKETETSCTLRFNISDTGIGIKPDVQKFLFQAFTQADGSMTRKFGGTGLGLAISKQLVEMMNGEIDVESVPGEGSTFFFTAQLEKQTDTKQKKITPRSDLKNLRILIVDDNGTNRKILMHQVTSWGMVADEADNAVTALIKLREATMLKRPYDLAILDLMMPSVDGFELAHFIKGDLQINNLKLILMPSFGQRGHAKTAREKGIDGYLVKPVRQTDLFECLATLMAGDEESENKSGIEAAKLITHHSIKEGKQGNQEIILVAEDNIVNQKVAKLQIERLGYQTEIVSNGLEAIEAFKKRSYSAILMDCQMPEMDGYTASAEIRRLENGDRRVPIIAMTANAMMGEREKCLAVGMDDYIAKPVKADILAQLLSYWIPTLGKDRESDLPANEVDQSNKVDISELDAMESLDPDVLNGFRELQTPDASDLITDLINLFVEDAGQRMEILKRSIEEGNTLSIKEQAHTFKGSAGNVGARRMAALSKKMEENVLDIERERYLFRELEKEFEAVVKLLKEMRIEELVEH